MKAVDCLAHDVLYDICVICFLAQVYETVFEVFDLVPFQKQLKLFGPYKRFLLHGLVLGNLETFTARYRLSISRLLV